MLPSLPQSGAKLLEMGSQTVEFLGDVGAVGENGRLLGQALFVDGFRALRRQQLVETLSQRVGLARRQLRRQLAHLAHQGFETIQSLAQHRTELLALLRARDDQRVQRPLDRVEQQRLRLVGPVGAALELHQFGDAQQIAQNHLPGEQTAVGQIAHQLLH